MGLQLCDQHCTEYRQETAARQSALRADLLSVLSSLLFIVPAGRAYNYNKLDCFL